MIKKIILSLLFINFVFADNFTLDQLRINQIKTFSKNLDNISNLSKKYILETYDIDVTSEKLKNHYNLPENYLKNIDGENLTFNFDNINGTFIISNISSNVINNSNKEYINKFLNNFNYTNNKINFVLDQSTSKLIELIKKIKLNPNVVLSTYTPIDNLKTWYKPTTDGIFEILSFSTKENKWINYGFLNNMNQTSIQTTSFDDLNKIFCLLNDKGFVISELKADSYLCNNESQWIKINTGSSSSLFNGESTILSLATELINSSGFSIGYVQDDNEDQLKKVFNGFKKFTKKDVKDTNGYWVDDSNSIFIANRIENIQSFFVNNGVKAYIPNQNNSKVVLLERINGEWFIIANGYNDVVQQDLTSLKVFDKKNNQYFKFINDYWVDITQSGVNIESTYLTNHSSGRDVFTSPKVNAKYLTLDNDCSLLTCNGQTYLNYFAGEQIDSMFVYYYSTLGNKKNNLIDATPAISITDIYNRKLYTGLVDNKVYIKDKDTLNRVCYKNISNNNYYTKGGIVISTGNNLPSSRTCETATYSGDSLILDTRTEVTDWITAPNNTKVYLTVNSTIYTHLVGSGKDFWTTDATGDGQINATEIFTRGDRTKFPMVTKNIVALSKLVDLPNYSTIGIVSTIDTSFKKWNYDNLDVKRVNNLIDK